MPHKFQVGAENPSIEQQKEKGQVQNSGCESQVQKQNQAEPAQGSVAQGMWGSFL